MLFSRSYVRLILPYLEQLNQGLKTAQSEIKQNSFTLQIQVY